MPRVSRSPRNSIKDRPRRIALLLRRQRGKLRPLAIVAACAALVLAASAIVHAARPAANLLSLRERLGGIAAIAGFRIEHVIINGRHHTPEPLLLAALGVHAGDPTLGFSVAAARARIESLTWVQSAVIERRLPDTVVVELIEKRPFALWQHDGRFSLIDHDGQVVEERDLRSFRGLPLVVGPGAPEHTAALLDALAQLPAISGRVAAAVRVGERRWNLVLKDGATIELPAGHAVVALQRLAELETKIALLDRPLAIVDMRLPDRLVVRPWPGHTPAAASPKEPG